MLGMRAALAGLVFLLAAPVVHADAKATYDKMCASCHGPDGKGNPDKAKALKLEPDVLNLGRAEAEKMSKDDVKNIIVKGKAKMPAYEKKLAAADVDPMVDYVWGLMTALRGK